MPENCHKVEGLENIREYLTKHNGYSTGTPFHFVHIHSCSYQMNLAGWISYQGDGMWKVGDIEFPITSVMHIWPESRKIWLE